MKILHCNSQLPVQTTRQVVSTPNTSQLQNKIYQLTGIAIGTVLLIFTNPVFAHKIKIAGDVAGLWHVEPNHNPQAGEETLAWVVLTRRGGKLIPFETVNCGMGVYAQPRQANDAPILTPTVIPINAEKSQGIPGARVTFPTPGIYQLQLNCQPRGNADFAAFKLTYDVTVLAGNRSVQANPIPTQGELSAQKEGDANEGWNLFPAVIVPGILVIGGLVWLVRRFKS